MGIWPALGMVAGKVGAGIAQGNLLRRQNSDEDRLREWALNLQAEQAHDTHAAHAVDLLSKIAPGSRIATGRAPLSTPTADPNAPSGLRPGDPNRYVQADGFFADTGRADPAHERLLQQRTATQLQLHQQFPDLVPATPMPSVEWEKMFPQLTTADTARQTLHETTAYHGQETKDRAASLLATINGQNTAHQDRVAALNAPHYSGLQGVDAEGKSTNLTLNDKTGEVKPTGFARPVQGGGTQADLEATRLAAASAQSTTADKIMSAYEDKVLQGQAQFTTADAILARHMLEGGPTEGPIAERMLNWKNPELAGYVRGARTVSSAERLIMPRGGGNMLQATEAMLSGAGPGAGPGNQLIDQARSVRRSLVNSLASHVKGGGTSSAPGTSSTPDASGALDPDLLAHARNLRQAGIPRDSARKLLGVAVQP